MYFHWLQRLTLGINMAPWFKIKSLLWCSVYNLTEDTNLPRSCTGYTDFIYVLEFLCTYIYIYRYTHTCFYEQYLFNTMQYHFFPEVSCFQNYGFYHDHLISAQDGKTGSISACFYLFYSLKSRKKFLFEHF